MNETEQGLLAGIDYGRRRIGIALSDRLRLTAQPFTQIEADSPDDAVHKVSEILKNKSIELAVFGKPLNMDGSESNMSREVESFASRVTERTGIPHELYDERLTSAQAHTVLKQTGYSGTKKKGKLDMISAQIMLQSYMDSGR